MTDTVFLGELERIFKEEFLKAAPLYQASSKIKLPYEDLHRPTLIYGGSLKYIQRQADLIVDYERLKTKSDSEELISLASEFGRQAGTLVDGLIRMENTRSTSDGQVADCRDTRNIKVIDIFEHPDGRRNLQIFYYQSPKDVSDAWFGYRFYFAAAAIVLEYKANATTSTGSQS